MLRWTPFLATCGMAVFLVVAVTWLLTTYRFVTDHHLPALAAPIATRYLSFIKALAFRTILPLLAIGILVTVKWKLARLLYVGLALLLVNLVLFG